MIEKVQLMKRSGRCSRSGFTMMELLTVIVIIAIVMATGVVSWVGARRGMEMRAASSSLQSTLSLARQHAVSKRRTTCIVFRNDYGTNCYYVFEKIGNAVIKSVDRLETLTPPGAGGFSPNGLTICNMSVPNGAIAANYSKGEYAASDGVHYWTTMNWLPAETKGWDIGHSYGLNVGDKMFLPPGITCQVADELGSMGDNRMITFYSNGRATGVGERKIKLTDKLGGGTVSKTFTVYPLVGLIKQE